MPAPSRPRCPDCGQHVLVAVTENRRRQLLEPVRDPVRDADDTGTGNVAARRDHLGTWWARALRRGERPAGGEHRYTPHKAVCRPQQLLPAARRRQAPSIQAASVPPDAAWGGNIISLEQARRNRRH